MAGKDSSVSPYLLRPLRTLEQVLRSRSRMGGSASEYAGALPTPEERNSLQTEADSGVQPGADDVID